MSAPDGLLSRLSCHKLASRGVSNRVIPLTSLTEPKHWVIEDLDVDFYYRLADLAAADFDDVVSEGLKNRFDETFHFSDSSKGAGNDATGSIADLNSKGKPARSETFRSLPLPD